MLPSEKLPQANWRTLAISALTPLLVAALLNLALLWWFQDSPYNRGFWLVQQKWNLALNPPAPADWLVMGDSSASFGVSASTLSQQKGVVAYNLATTGDRTVLDGAWLLSTYLQKHPAPKVVLLVHAPTVWYLEAQKATMLPQIPLAWGFWEQLQPSFQPSLREQWTVLQWRYLPLIAQNRTLTEFMRHPRSAFTLDFTMQADGSTQYLGLKPDHLAKTASDQIYITQVVPFNVAADNRAALEQYAKLAQQYGFQLYLSNGPIYDVLVQDETYHAFLAQAEAMLAEFASTHPHVTYLSQVQAFPSTVMESPYHPLPTAAEQFTLGLLAQMP
ncbi:MAG TPA: hypothetical protein PK299_11295 [Anaerolineales bacterium]|nr:hypothetical protein [Anaerolineales bacterium]